MSEAAGSSGPALVSPRLELRPFRAQDAEALYALFTDREVRRWLLDGEIVAREWVDREVAQSEARFAGGGCGLWTLREPRAQALLGFVGFRHFWNPPELELVYGLYPSAWGRGYATEGGHAAMAYAFDTLGFDEVKAATDVPNKASVAVLERLGFEEWRRTDDGPEGTIFFRVAAARWRARVTSPR